MYLTLNKGPPMTHIMPDEFETALDTVAAYTLQEVISVAQKRWDKDEYLRQEYLVDGEEFNDYLRTHLEDTLETDDFIRTIATTRIDDAIAAKIDEIS